MRGARRGRTVIGQRVGAKESGLRVGRDTFHVAMSIAVLGPANGNEEALGRAAAHFAAMPDVDRVVYLGTDGLLDHVVSAWAHQLVGDDASDWGLWDRAAIACASAEPDAIEAFVVAEKRRAQLRRLESLAAPGSWAVELLGGRWAFLTDSTTRLTDDHLAPVTFVVFGDGPDALFQQRGARWLLCPGPLSKNAGMILFEEEAGVGASLIGSQLEVVRRERLVSGQATKLRIADGRSE